MKEMIDKKGNKIHRSDTLVLSFPEYHPEAKELNGRLVQISKVITPDTFHPYGLDPVSRERFNPVVSRLGIHIPFEWTIIND